MVVINVLSENVNLLRPNITLEINKVFLLTELSLQNSLINCESIVSLKYFILPFSGSPLRSGVKTVDSNP